MIIKPMVSLGCNMLNKALHGNILDAIRHIPSWEECSALCTQNARRFTKECTAWTWVEQVQSCFLKWGNPPPSNLTGVVSGPANCKPGEFWCVCFSSA